MTITTHRPSPGWPIVPIDPPGTGIHAQRQLTLGTDCAGQPTGWLSWQDVVTLTATERVAWTTGPSLGVIHGGWNQAGVQSDCPIPAILASTERHRHYRNSPALINGNLFRRDRHLCLYCGNGPRPDNRLTRDHVIPRGQGGLDHWENVVTACSRCNHHKGCRTPQQAGMSLLAVPYRPTWAEYLVLANRRILADQMDFLTPFLPTR